MYKRITHYFKVSGHKEVLHGLIEKNPFEKGLFLKLFS